MYLSQVSPFIVKCAHFICHFADTHQHSRKTCWLYKLASRKMALEFGLNWLWFCCWAGSFDRVTATVTILCTTQSRAFNNAVCIRCHESSCQFSLTRIWNSYCTKNQIFCIAFSVVPPLIICIFCRTWSYDSEICGLTTTNIQWFVILRELKQEQWWKYYWHSYNNCRFSRLSKKTNDKLVKQTICYLHIEIEKMQQKKT